MRLAVPLALIGWGLGCAPPSEENTAPAINVIAPKADVVVNQGAPLPITLELRDADGDAPIGLVVASDVDGVLLNADILSDEETYQNQLPELSPGSHVLSFTVTDGKPDGERVRAVPIRINAAPSSPPVTLSPAVPGPNDDLIGDLTADANDPEGSPLGYTWTWLKNGSTFRTGSGRHTSVEANKTTPGEVWTIRFEISEMRGSQPDPVGITVTLEEHVTIANTAPPAPQVHILPSQPHAAQGLRCMATSEPDADGDPVTFTYAWSVDDGSGFVNVQAHTDAVLPIAATSPGDVWRCTATPSDGYIDGEASSHTATVRTDAYVVDASSADITMELSATGGSLSVVHLDTAPGADLVAVADEGSSQVSLFPMSEVLAATEPVLISQAQAEWAAAGGIQQLSVCPDVDGDSVSDLLIVSADGSMAVTDLQGWSLLDETPLVETVAGVFGNNTALTSMGKAVAANMFDTPRAEVVVALHDLVVADQLMVFPSAKFGAGETLNASDRRVRIVSAFVDDTLGTDIDLRSDFFGTSGGADGFSDLLIGRRAGLLGTSDERRIAMYVFSGAAIGQAGTLMLEIANASKLTFYDAADVDAATQVGTLADVDGDGNAEPWFTSPGAAESEGRLLLFSTLGAGAFDTYDTADDDHILAITGLAAGDRFGEQAMALGDLDDDGFEELAVSAPGAQQGRGQVYLFDGARIAAAAGVSGAPGSLSAADADWTLVGPQGDQLRLLDTPQDWDGDGQPDLVLATSTQAMVWLTGR